MKEHAGKRGGEVETRGKEWGQKWEIIIVWPGEISLGFNPASDLRWKWSFQLVTCL